MKIISSNVDHASSNISSTMDKISDSSSLIKTYMMCKVTFLMQWDYKRDFELKECSAMLFSMIQLIQYINRQKKKWKMNSEMKDTYHNHVEDKSENISMLISEL